MGGVSIGSFERKSRTSLTSSILRLPNLRATNWPEEIASYNLVLPTPIFAQASDTERPSGSILDGNIVISLRSRSRTISRMWPDHRGFGGGIQPGMARNGWKSITGRWRRPSQIAIRQSSALSSRGCDLLKDFGCAPLKNNRRHVSPNRPDYANRPFGFDRRSLRERPIHLK